MRLFNDKETGYVADKGVMQRFFKSAMVAAKLGFQGSSNFRHQRAFLTHCQPQTWKIRLPRETGTHHKSFQESSAVPLWLNRGNLGVFWELGWKGRDSREVIVHDFYRQERIRNVGLTRLTLDQLCDATGHLGAAATSRSQWPLHTDERIT